MNKDFNEDDLYLLNETTDFTPNHMNTCIRICKHCGIKKDTEKCPKCDKK